MPARTSLGAFGAQRQASQITRLTIVSMVFLPIIFLTGFFSTKWMTAAIDSGSTLLVLGLLLLSVAGVAAMLVWVNRRRSA